MKKLYRDGKCIGTRKCCVCKRPAVYGEDVSSPQQKQLGQTNEELEKWCKTVYAAGFYKTKYYCGYHDKRRWWGRQSINK